MGYLSPTWKRAFPRRESLTWANGNSATKERKIGPNASRRFCSNNKAILELTAEVRCADFITWLEANLDRGAA